MSHPGLGVVGLLLTGAVCGAAPAAWSATPAPPLFRYTDPAISESSGLAVSSYDDRVVYTHNDSGDTARFFAVDVRTGRTLAAYRLPGATNVDWEDMAAVREGGPVLWFADIGDNSARRTEVSLYRVPEPQPGRQLGPVTRFRLRYPDGPHDAEALLAMPGGEVYLATKSLAGSTAVYAVPIGTGRPGVLRRVATVGLGLGQAVTGGAVAPAGDRLVLRTYTDAYAWPLDAGGLPAALRRPPVRVPLPPMPQGEAVAFRPDGSLLVGGEGAHAAVYAVALPRQPASRAPVPVAGPVGRGHRPALVAAAGAALVLAVLVTAAGVRRCVRRGARRPSRCSR